VREIDPSLFLLGVVGATTLIVLGLGRRKGLAAVRARASVGRVLEWVGLTLLFLIGNVLAGFLAVLVLRRVTGGFVSLYLAADATLLALSAIQATALHWWRTGPDG